MQAAAADSASAAPSLPNWQVLELEQKAFWATAQSRVEIDPAAEELGQLWRLSATSSVVGNSEQVIVDLDPASGASVHRSRLSRGKDQRFKSFEYRTDSIVRERRSPGADSAAPAQDWPVSSRKDIPYPLDGSERPVVTDAYTLLLLADRLQASGDTAAEVVVHTEFNFYRVRMTCGNGIPVSVNYQVAAGETVQARRETRAVALQVEPLGTPVDKPDFSLLGLHDDIILFFDRASGLLVQVRGVAPRIGATQINLKTVTMREPPPVMRCAGPVGLISNPGSGHNRDKFEQIRQRFDRHAAIHHIITNSPAEIGPALHEMAEREVAVLAINGGDGTASAILGQLVDSGLFVTPPLIALLPGGTANMNAGDIGIRGSLDKASARFCQWCEGSRDSGRLQQRPLLRVVISPGGAPQFGMFLGAGAIIQGTEYAHSEVHSRGLRDDFSLALITLRTVWGVLRDDPRFNRHVAVDLSLDGAEAVQHDTLILAISTLQRLAFGMRPFWGAEAGSIRLTLIEQHCSRFARTFFSIARGRPNRNAIPTSGYFSHNAGRIQISLTGKLNLDGEILEADGPVQVSASPALDFLVL